MRSLGYQQRAATRVCGGIYTRTSLVITTCVHVDVNYIAQSRSFNFMDKAGIGAQESSGRGELYLLVINTRHAVTGFQSCSNFMFCQYIIFLNTILFLQIYTNKDIHILLIVKEHFLWSDNCDISSYHIILNIEDYTHT